MNRCKSDGAGGVRLAERANVGGHSNGKGRAREKGKKPRGKRCARSRKSFVERNSVAIFKKSAQ